MSRRPLAVVKNSLNRDCSKLVPPTSLYINATNKDNWCDWAPFDKSNANQLLGILDSCYVFAYAVSMFISGFIAERVDLRYYLSLGMLLSGIFTYLFGIAYYLDIHSFPYFVLVQILGGIVQSTGWPGVVVCVGNWFGKSRRGLIFGIWNAHLYVGNMLGAYVAGYFVVHNWGMSFIIPAVIIGVLGFLMFLFLVPHPEDVGCEPTDHLDLTPPQVSAETAVQNYTNNSPPVLNGFLPSSLEKSQEHCFNHPVLTENSPLTYRPPSPSSTSSAASSQSSSSNKQAITFWKALQIPGVLEFSLCLFFSKLVSYTFLFWLPRYLAHTTGKSSQDSAYLSIVFDVGGIIGGILAGAISDKTKSSAITCLGFLALGIPCLLVYNLYGGVSDAANIVLQLVCGALVNGPYALITTAVSAELGTHGSLQNNSKALATVTAIIDGTGSIGAAVGPLLAGVVSELSWSYVFYMVMVANFFALLSLCRTGWKEFRRIFPAQKCCSFLPCTQREIYERI